MSDPGTPTHATPGTAGNARPYAGGDPYADYRAVDLPFAGLPDLADRRLGGSVLAANDEFFAERDNLLTPEPARFDPDAFGPKGKVMDGWETRRRRGADPAHPLPTADAHDWALVRLGLPGVVHGVVVDTAHFRGNHPREVSVEGTALPGTPAAADLLAPHVRWTTLVSRTPVAGHAANGFPVDVPRRLTHLRLRQYPDGGIARFRVHGAVVPDPRWLAALDTFDLLATEHGGTCQDASDRFYSAPGNLLRPGRPTGMHDGWENRRRRDEGHDWVRFSLAGHAVVRAVEIDTGWFRGNAPGWIALHGCDTTTGADPDTPGDWRELLAPTAVRPDTVHRFLDLPPTPCTHVRLDVLPDGGVARLRLHGSLTATGRRALTDRWTALTAP